MRASGTDVGGEWWWYGEETVEVISKAFVNPTSLLSSGARMITQSMSIDVHTHTHTQSMSTSGDPEKVSRDCMLFCVFCRTEVYEKTARPGTFSPGNFKLRQQRHSVFLHTLRGASSGLQASPVTPRNNRSMPPIKTPTSSMSGSHTIFSSFHLS